MAKSRKFFRVILDVTVMVSGIVSLSFRINKCQNIKETLINQRFLNASGGGARICKEICCFAAQIRRWKRFDQRFHYKLLYAKRQDCLS
jgi:uncharacterized membrane protein YkgB